MLGVGYLYPIDNECECLNPCFSGRYAGSKKLEAHERGNAEVLILVFREDMLGDSFRWEREHREKKS